MPTSRFILIRAALRATPDEITRLKMLASRLVIDWRRRFTKNIGSDDPTSIVVNFGVRIFVRRGLHDHDSV